MATVSEAIQPPRTSVGVLGWLRENLFSTWYNTLLTFGSLWLIYVILRGVGTWALTRARWDAVTTNLALFMIGPFPREEVWRVWACVLMVVLLGGLSWVVWGPLGRGRTRARRWVVVGWLLSFPLTILLLRGLGGNSVLPRWARTSGAGCC